MLSAMPLLTAVTPNPVPQAFGRRIEGDSFKAHDLALDQTVTVRQAMPTSPRAGDARRQNVQQLVFVRNPNFLNILDVVLDKSSGSMVSGLPDSTKRQEAKECLQRPILVET